jgi:four helix bundle protein
MGQSFRDLIAWQRAMQLVTDIYRISNSFPRSEIYGLTSQIRRAAVSVASNIAEGQARHSHREFMHFLSIARGSIAEVQTQLLIAQSLAYLDTTQTESLTNQASDVCRLVNALYTAIERRTKNEERRTASR